MRCVLALALLLPLSAQTPEPAPAGVPGFPLEGVLAHHEAHGQGAALLAQRATLCFLLGKSAQAEELVNQALQKAPNNAEVYRMAALAYLGAGQPERAFALHEKMLQVAPKADDHMAYAAGDLVQAGFPEKADAMMERSFQLDPGDKDELLAFACAASRSGHSALAVKWIQRLTGMDKGDARQEGMYAFFTFIGGGRIDEAAAMADRLLQVLPRNWEIPMHVARICLSAGRLDQAKIWLTRAESANPSDARMMTELALLAKGRGWTFRD